MKIDSNIPIPTPPRKRAGEEFPFDKLDIGESFFVPNLRAMQLRSMARPYRPKKFIARNVRNDDDVKGARIWRIE